MKAPRWAATAATTSAAAAPRSRTLYVTNRDSATVPVIKRTCGITAAAHAIYVTSQYGEPAWATTGDR